MTNQKSGIRSQKSRRSAGLSLVEMLMALAITAMLLTATMVAIDASFKAYAIAAESASTQTATRMVINRLLTMVRTSTAHGPMFTETGVTIHGNVLTSPYIDIMPADAPPFRVYRITYDAQAKELRLLEIDTEPLVERVIDDQPIIGGVTACSFQLLRRRDNDDVWVLDRASIDFTVQPDGDTSLAIEVGNVPAVRVVASTKPRRLD